MRQQASARRWRGTVVSALLLLLGSSFVGIGCVQAEEPVARETPASIRLESLATGYRPSGSLGFALRDTAIAEQVYRRNDGGERGVLWSAQFVSRWALTEDQLDRWSAQAGGLLLDGLGDDVQLASWERLNASDVGDQRVAYRYTLATSQGQPVGEATIVVFSRGAQVSITAAATTGARPPLDAIALARLLDSPAATSPRVA